MSMLPTTAVCCPPLMGIILCHVAINDSCLFEVTVNYCCDTANAMFGAVYNGRPQI